MIQELAQDQKMAKLGFKHTSVKRQNPAPTPQTKLLLHHPGAEGWENCATDSWAPGCPEGGTSAQPSPGMLYASLHRLCPATYDTWMRGVHPQGVPGLGGPKHASTRASAVDTQLSSGPICSAPEGWGWLRCDIRLPVTPKSARMAEGTGHSASTHCTRPFHTRYLT